mmetsp:Transcript_11986/g.18057  ORF Transcript_11986/g.18057 Transcript_11986/m.18057 type:complete len:106 (+) Transcript_11986:102-419(+)
MNFPSLRTQRRLISEHQFYYFNRCALYMEKCYASKVSAFGRALFGVWAGLGCSCQWVEIVLTVQFKTGKYHITHYRTSINHIRLIEAIVKQVSNDSSLLRKKEEF